MKYGKIALKRVAELEDIIAEMQVDKYTPRMTVRTATGRIDGTTSLERVIPFRAGRAGSMDVAVKINTSRAVTIKILLDGEVCHESQLSSGDKTVRVSLFGVELGGHELAIKVNGTASFNLVSLEVEMYGYLEWNATDVFVQALASSAGYIKVALGRFEVYELSGKVAAFSFPNVVRANAFSFEGRDFAVLSLKNQTVCVVDLSDLTAVKGKVVCSGGRAVAGYDAGGRIGLLVGTNAGVRQYFYDYESGETVGGSVVLSNMDELIVGENGGRRMVYSVKNGYTFLSRAMDEVEYGVRDRFTFNGSAEV